MEERQREAAAKAKAERRVQYTPKVSTSAYNSRESSTTKKQPAQSPEMGGKGLKGLVQHTAVLQGTVGDWCYIYFVIPSWTFLQT